ncbi:MAG: alpha/beta hydrolase [Steroidobacteraceae bacterium]|jgi:pimeloyl-[acyl-carrier protein] methyl ester esterase|nr:alpha/beta hydrolase [Steroidobacteraceae bacterium]
MAYLAVADDRKIYFEHYPGKGLPVVLIHGWGMSCRVWDTTLVALQEAGHAVVSFDQRGCGSSDKDFPVISIEQSAADAVALLRHLGIGRAAVNGWSLGGAVAVETARLLGPACAGVVVTAGATPRYVQAPDFPQGNPPGSTAQTVAMLRADRANFLYALSQGVCAVPQSPQMIEWMWSIFMQAGPGADAALLQLDTVDQRATLAALEAPLLSIVGAKDAIVPPDICRAAGRLAKRGSVVEFEECGHAPFIEDGPRYRSVLLDFLAKIA